MKGGVNLLSLGFSEEELEDYFESALNDAVIFCITSGIDAESIETTTVKGFSLLYQSLKRIEAQRIMEAISVLRVSVWSDKKEYTEYIDNVGIWLHKVSRTAAKGSSKSGDRQVGIDELLKDFKGQVHYGR